MLTLNVRGRAAGLDRLRSRLSDAAGLLSALAEPALDAVRGNFIAGGRPTPWAPLAESTRKGRGSQAAPLVDTGRLMASVKAALKDGRLVLSTSLPYGAVQQFGARAGRNGAARIPARPFLVLPPQEVKRLAGILAGRLGGKS